MEKKWQDFWEQSSGIVAVTMALGMVVFLGFAALALDIGHLISVKQELQRAADAGAMAGARGLWPNTLPIISDPPPPDCPTAQTRALDTATNQGNQVDGAATPGSNVTVEVGRWDYGTNNFTPGCSAATNAVKVTIQKNGINHLFAQILGESPASQTAFAIAIMDFFVDKGSLPIAISSQAVQDATPGQDLFIKFSPDKEDNGGWFAKPPDKANAKTFSDYINNGACPPLQVGDIVELQNGFTSVLQDLKAKLAEHGGSWDIVLPLVNTKQFNQDAPIVNFLPFRITEVQDSGSSKGVTGTVLELLESATASPVGVNKGVLAPPKLVN